MFLLLNNDTKNNIIEYFHLNHIFHRYQFFFYIFEFFLLDFSVKQPAGFAFKNFIP